MSSLERSVWLKYVSFISELDADEIKILSALIDRGWGIDIEEVVS